MATAPKSTSRVIVFVVAGVALAILIGVGLYYYALVFGLFGGDPLVAPARPGNPKVLPGPADAGSELWTQDFAAAKVLVA